VDLSRVQARVCTDEERQVQKVNRSKQLVANILTAGAMASLLCVSVAHAQKLPRFTDYPVSESFSGKTAPLVLSGEARAFRTRLKEAAREKPNFAGHFIVTTWGCGTECVMGAVIDASTGRVFMLPTTLCCWAPASTKSSIRSSSGRTANSSCFQEPGTRRRAIRPPAFTSLRTTGWY
jgi:hypothetical protein